MVLRFIPVEQFHETSVAPFYFSCHPFLVQLSVDGFCFGNTQAEFSLWQHLESATKLLASLQHSPHPLIFTFYSLQ